MFYILLIMRNMQEASKRNYFL